MFGRTKNRRLLVALLTLALSLTLIPWQGLAASKVDVTLTEIKYFNDKQEVFGPGATIENWEVFYTRIGWKMDSSKTVAEGDYFDITLPDEFRISDDSTANVFDLLGTDGAPVIATATVTAGAEGKGGNIHVVFNGALVGKYNIAGDLWYASRFWLEKEPEVGAGFNFTFQAGESKITENMPQAIGPVPHGEEYITKWVNDYHQDEQQMTWYLRINLSGQKPSSAKVEDKISAPNGQPIEGYNIVPGSFKLYEVNYDKYGEVMYPPGYQEVSWPVAPPVLSADQQGFSVDLGGLLKDGQSYALTYRTSYPLSTVLRNTAKLTTSIGVYDIVTDEKSAASGGSGDGDLTDKIKIIKVDENNESIKLPNAEFTLTSVADPTKVITLKTDGNGEAVTPTTMPPGEYTLVEVKAPEGYQLVKTPIPVSVVAGKATIRTIKNILFVPLNVAVHLKKMAPADLMKKDTFTFQLLAADKTTVLDTKVMGWDGFFDGTVTLQTAFVKPGDYTLWVKELKGDDAGILYDETLYELRYHVKVSASGTALVLDQGDPETIIHKPGAEPGPAPGGAVVFHNTPLTDIPVEKKWVGPVGPAVTIQLLADGTEVAGKTMLLNAGNNWKGTFEKLPRDKYVNVGTGSQWVAIRYGIKELAVPGYATAITATSTGGFVVTNTNSETVAVPVEKTWVGPVGTEVTIQLLANGVEVSGKTLTLNVANSWKGSFAGLPRFDSAGKEIAYTIKELKIAGYSTTVTGSAAGGFVVTNTNSETVAVPVEKTWVGPVGTEVTIQLFADGAAVDGETLTLNAANNWKGSFLDLPKYDDSGHAIEYTVSEPSVEGYTTTITGDQVAGYTVTNKEIPPPPVENPEYPAIKLPLDVKKRMKNAPLKSGAFTFQLKNAGGTVLAEVTNLADGSVVFPERSFSRVVTDYTYTVVEVPGTDKRIAYDTTVYTVKVTTRAVGGKLEASVALERNGLPFDGTMVFTNVKKTPATGDNMVNNIMLMLALALALGAAAVIVKKQRMAER